MTTQRRWKDVLPLVLLLLLFASLLQPARLSGASASMTEFPLPTAGSQPGDIAAGPDGNLWFTEFAGNRIGRVTLTGVIVEFPIPTANSQPMGLTAGPDGNLWFVERSGNKIGRITTAGAITEFPIPTANSFPYDIAAGSDGNLWFTEFTGNKIGRITTTGAITEFTTPTPGSHPFGITAGPDGNLWFAEDGAAKIARITPTGTITEFPLPTDSRVWGITAGSNGNIWFTELDANRIGRITPAGVVTEFDVPTPSADVDAIAAGPDGNLWFTELAFAGNRIGRITPAGVITEFPITTPNSGPDGIVAGPDGNLWFTESAGNTIGRLEPPAEPALEVLPSAAATGADLHVTGAGWPSGARVDLQLRSASGMSVTLGNAVSDSHGRLQVTLKLPGLAAGAYQIAAACQACDPSIAVETIRFTVLPAPAVQLSPAAGPPGTTVTVNVTNLTPGSLRLDYAGVAVLGPMPVNGSSFSGSFVVPNDRPSPLGAATTVTAINLVSGNIVGQSPAVSFQSQPAPVHQSPVLRDVRLPSAPLKPGQSATITGKLDVGPGAQLAEHQVVALWKMEGAPPVPLRREQFTLKDDGSFELTVAMPSLLKGDAVPAQTSGAIGLVAVGPLDKAYQETPVQVQGTTMYAQPQVEVRRKTNDPTNNTLILGAKITRKYLATKPVQIVDNKIVPAHPILGDFFAQYGDLSWLTADPIEALQYIGLGNLPGACVLQAEDPLKELWADPHEKVVLPQQFELPATGIPLTSPVVVPGALRTQATPEVLEAEVWRVEVDASKQGYGNVNSEGVYTRYSEVFVVIPGKNFVFRLIMSDNDGLTAEKEQTPIQVLLPPLPLNYKSVNILLLETNGPHDGAGQLHTLRGLNIPPQIINATPLTMTLVVERTSDVSVATPTFRWDNMVLQPSVHEEILNPPPGNDPCKKPGGVPEPPRMGIWYTVTIPNSHLQTDGPHTLKYTFSGNLGVGSELHFNYEADVSSWITNAGYTNQSVKWSPKGVTLSAQRPPRSDASVSTSAEETPRTGPIHNQARVGCLQVRQSFGANGPTLATVGGSVGGTGLNGDDEFSFGKGSCAVSSTASQTGVTVENVPQSYPLFGPSTTTLVPHLEYSMPDLDIGIPFVVTVGVGGSMWVKADITRQGELLFEQNGTPADVVLTVTPSGEIGGEVHINAKLVAGLVAKGEARITGVGNLSMPVTFKNGGLDNSHSEFRYHVYLTLFVGSGCDPIGIFGGGCLWHDSVPIDIIGPGCKGCPSTTQSALPQAEAPAPPYAEPAIATDGLGNTFALWRVASNRLAFSRYLNGAWSAPSFIPTGLGAFSPKIAFVAPNRAVAVWVESSLNAEQAKNATLESAIKSQHLAYALWNGSAWSPAQALTAPNLGEGRLALAGCPQGGTNCPPGGEVTAVWERNVAADFSKRQIRLFYSMYRNGVWSASQPVDPGAAALAPTDTQAEVAYRQGAPLVAWVRDADHSLATVADRRIATRLLSTGSTVESPSSLPNRIAEIALAANADGTPRLAFTRIEPNAQLLDTRHALYSGMLASGGWISQQLFSNDRPIYAEQPVLTLDASGKGTITFRGLGFGPDKTGALKVYSQDALGMTTHTGELSQVEADFSSQQHSPHYLTGDGAVNWQPAAVFDQVTNSTIALAVSGPAPGLNRRLRAQLAAAPSLARAVVADQPLVFASVPRQPDFVVAAIQPSARFPQPSQPLSVDMQLRNDGVAWQSDGRQSLDVVATWDGGPGVGAAAGNAQVMRLEAGQPVNVRLNLTPPATLDRPHKLVITVNPYQRIAEPSALNNQRDAQVGGIPAPTNLQAAAKRGIARALLRWDAPQDPRIVGYRVYRVSANGLRTPAGSSFISAWIDGNVAMDQTYRYVVTAYTADGVESEPSEPVTVTLNRYRVLLPILRR